MSDYAGQTLSDYLASLGARQSTPGGGTVAAISGAQASALISMVARFTRGQEEQIDPIIDRAAAATKEFLKLADADGKAFNKVMRALRDKGQTGLQEALYEAAAVPVQVIELGSLLSVDLEILSRIGNANLVTDVGIAAEMLIACIAASELNVLINTNQMTDSKKRSGLLKKLNLAADIKTALKAISAEISASLSSLNSPNSLSSLNSHDSHET